MKYLLPIGFLIFGMISVWPYKKMRGNSEWILKIAVPGWIAIVGAIIMFIVLIFDLGNPFK